MGQVRGLAWGVSTHCAPLLSPLLLALPCPQVPPAHFGGIWGTPPTGRGREGQKDLEMLGVDPKTSCMQSKCSSAELHPLCKGRVVPKSPCCLHNPCAPAATGSREVMHSGHLQMLAPAPGHHKMDFLVPGSAKEKNVASAILLNSQNFGAQIWGMILI